MLNIAKMFGQASPIFFVLFAFAAWSSNGLLCNPRNGQPPPANGLPTCSLPIADYVSGRAVPGSTNRTTAYPPWMNITLARQGQAFAQKHIFFTMLTALPGLISGLALPDEASVLAFTGNTANTTTALKRYVATAAQLQVWMEDIFCEEELDNAVLTSIYNVRQHHIKAAERANAHGLPYVQTNHYDSNQTDDILWAAIAADFQASAYTRRTWSPAYEAYNGTTTAINQYVQGLTLIQFYGYLIIDPVSTMIYDATEDELAAYLHAWAVLGWILGIDDDYNPALQPDPITAAAYTQALLEEYTYPSWFQMSKIGKVLIEAVLNNYNRFFPSLGPRPLLLRFMRDYFKVPVTNTMNTLTLADKLALQTFDETFVPSTHIQAERVALGLGVDGAVNGSVMAYFGPNVVTYLDKAKYAFYPNVTG